MQSVFLHGHVPGKKHFSAGKCARQGARSGCKLLILGGATNQPGSLTPPYTTLPNEGQTEVPLPKFFTSDTRS